MDKFDIELTASCNKLRILIRNEQLEKDYAEEWRKMGKTSTQQRRIKNEVRTSTVQISVRNYTR